MEGVGKGSDRKWEGREGKRWEMGGEGREEEGKEEGRETKGFISHILLFEPWQLCSPVTTTRPCIAFSSHSPDGTLVTDNQNAQTNVCLYFAMCFTALNVTILFPSTRWSVLRREFIIILMLRENRRLYRRFD